MNVEESSLVIYCDGGSLNEERIGGWGIHGYFFKPDVPKQGSGCQKAILTAQGYKLKESKDTAGSPVTILAYVDGFGSIPFGGTNNVAELTAALEGYRVILTTNPKDVLFYSDSKYLIQGLTEWSDKWVKNNWIKQDGTEVANKELWIRLLELKALIDEAKIQITYQWIKGHSGDVGNDMADQYATFGLTVAKKGELFFDVKITEAKGYWSKSFEHNRMVDKSCWYFNSYHPMMFEESIVKTKEGKWIYYIGDHGPDDDDYGKPVSDSSFAVLHLKDPVPEMEMIRQMQNTFNPLNQTNVVIGRLNRILSSTMLEVLNERGTILFEKQRYERNIVFGKELLTRERNPAQLAFRAAEYINSLESILNEYLKGSKDILVTDITNLFYSTETKAKKLVLKLKPDISTATKKVDVLCHYDTKKLKGEIKIPLLLGIDTPSRNTLSALAEKDPTFHILTWKESDTAFRYATVLKAGDDIGIWAGVYSNIRMLTP